jgi:hypothetical protein
VKKKSFVEIALLESETKAAVGAEIVSNENGRGIMVGPCCEAIYSMD